MALKTGLHRIAQGLRWLSFGWFALWVVMALSGEFGSLQSAIVSVLALTVIPSGIGLLLGWIVDGFANREG